MAWAGRPKKCAVTAFGFASPNAAEDHLRALAKKGAILMTAEARSGQIVVARLEDEVTVKRLKRRGGRVELIAENPDYAPIVINGPLAIEGLVVGLIRGGRPL